MNKPKNSDAESNADPSEDLDDVLDDLDMEESDLAADAQGDDDIEEPLEGAISAAKDPDEDGELEPSVSSSDEDTLAKSLMLDSMRLEAKVEAIIFASAKPIKSLEILDLLNDDNVSPEDVELTVSQLVDQYDRRGGGFRLHYVKRQGYQFRTTPAAGRLMERMFASRPRPLSRAAQETLAIIAYRQPTTRAEVEFIRGVDAGSIVKNLLERDLIRCVGRKEIAGRPMLFGTTDEFLKIFQIGSLRDLPPLEAFQPENSSIREALKKIEKAGEEIDLEDYVGDVSGSAASEAPELSADDSEDIDFKDNLPDDEEGLEPGLTHAAGNGIPRAEGSDEVEEDGDFPSGSLGEGPTDVDLQ